MQKKISFLCLFTGFVLKTLLGLPEENGFFSEESLETFAINTKINPGEYDIDLPMSLQMLAVGDEALLPRGSRGRLEETLPNIQEFFTARLDLDLSSESCLILPFGSRDRGSIKTGHDYGIVTRIDWNFISEIEGEDRQTVKKTDFAVVLRAKTMSRPDSSARKIRTTFVRSRKVRQLVFDSVQFLYKKFAPPLVRDVVDSEELEAGFNCIMRSFENPERSAPHKLGRNSFKKIKESLSDVLTDLSWTKTIDTSEDPIRIFFVGYGRSANLAMQLASSFLTTKGVRIYLLLKNRKLTIPETDTFFTNLKNHACIIDISANRDMLIREEKQYEILRAKRENPIELEEMDILPDRPGEDSED